MAFVVDKALMGKPREKFWVSYIKQRIKQNKNFLGFISGQTGSGKSFSSLSIAEQLDPKFTIDQCVFGGIELMDLINSGKLKRGSVIIFEEMGVEMDARNWQSLTNKMLNYLFQTFRHKGFILIMNSPFMDFVDKSTRKLFHAELQTVGINFKTEEVKLKPMLLQYNARKQKFYYKRLKVITSEGRIPINIWKVIKPSKKLLKEYEIKKKNYTDQLNKDICDKLRESKNGKKKELTEIQQEVLDFLKEGKTVKQIAEERGRTTDVIHRCMNLIRKKGYKLKTKYNNGKLVGYGVIEPEGK